MSNKDNIIMTLLDDIKPERLIELCVTDQQKQIICEIFYNKYKLKFMKGLQYIDNLGYYLSDILYNFGINNTISNTRVLQNLHFLLKSYPNKFSYKEIDYHFRNQHLFINEQAYDSLQELINELLRHTDTDGHTDKEIISAFLKGKVNEGVVFYNNSYYNNVKKFNIIDPDNYNDVFIKINDMYYLGECMGGTIYYDNMPYNKFYIRSMPTKKDRISNLFKLLNKLLTHMRTRQHTYDEYLLTIIKLLENSIYDLELEWFDYAICEAIYGSFSKLYEVYVKN